MRQMVKRVVNRLLRPAGLEVRRIQDQVANEQCDPFWVQGQLIKNKFPTIFDVGAHIGNVTAVYRSLFPTATIHAFEPYPESFQALKTRFHSDPLVKPHAAAVSDSAGVIEMNLNADTYTNSIFKSATQGAEFWGENRLDTREIIKVPTTTIDDYCRNHAIQTIDILKLDIQGAELKALQGARSILESGRVDLVYMELLLAPTYQGQPAFEDYLHFFNEVGYTLLDLFNPTRKNFYMIQSDIIWLPVKRVSG